MNNKRIKNAKKNIFYGGIQRITLIFFPFMVRTVLIKYLGANYLGLSSLLTSILSVLSLAELGFSSAIIYCMYLPIAQGDTDTICALLLYYKKIYRIIGEIVFVGGMLILPFLPKFIHGEYPTDINIYILYIIYLLNASLSYFLFSYYNSLICAFQRYDLISKVSIIVTIGMHVVQIITLIYFKNYYIYAVAIPIFSIINNLGIYAVVRKYFSDYTCRGALSQESRKDIKQKVKALFITKLKVATRNTFDSIFISAFLGLTVTAIYNNYFYVLSAVSGIVVVLLNAITAGIGNSVAIESADKNYEDMNKFNFSYMWLSGWCTICMVCLYQDFMFLWMGPKLIFPMSICILFCIYFYALKMGDVRAIYIEVRGLWWESRYIAIAEVAANIILNYCLGKLFGVYGIITATIITILILNFGWGSKIAFKYYFKKQTKEYFSYHAKYALITCLNGIVIYAICSKVQDVNVIIGLCKKIVICCILPNVIYYLVYSRNRKYKGYIEWYLKMFLKQ